jgi:hypothetical protein
MLQRSRVALLTVVRGVAAKLAQPYQSVPSAGDELQDKGSSRSLGCSRDDVERDHPQNVYRLQGNGWCRLVEGDDRTGDKSD